MPIPTLQQGIEDIIESKKDTRLTKATVWFIDGIRVDIRLGTSSNIIKNCEVVGDVAALKVGDEVNISWGTNGRPVVNSGTSGLASPRNVVYSTQDADTLDGEHGTYYLSRVNHTGTQLPNSISPQGASSGLDADKVDGNHAADLLNRAMHTGAQDPSTISPQGASSTLDADMVDSYHASENPGASSAVVATDSNGKATVLLADVSEQLKVLGDGSSYGVYIGTDTQLYRSGINAISTGGDSFSATKLTASTAGTGGGVYIGGDTQLYRTSADVIRTPDSIQIDAGLGVGGSNATAGSIRSTGEIYTIVWTDLSSGVTITGWSSLTEQHIWYKKVGKTMFMKFYLLGTSNAAGTSFMLHGSNPMTTSMHNLDIVVRRCDNGSWGWGFGEIPVATPYIINFYPTADGGSWTASGQKAVMGEFFYHVD